MFEVELRGWSGLYRDNSLWQRIVAWWHGREVRYKEYWSVEDHLVDVIGRWPCEVGRKAIDGAIRDWASYVVNHSSGSPDQLMQMIQRRTGDAFNRVHKKIRISLVRSRELKRSKENQENYCNDPLENFLYNLGRKKRPCQQKSPSGA
jgi:hypothetical protein